MHVSEAASKNATSTRFVDVLVRKSERAPGKAIAKRPDCPAKVDNREIVLFEIFTRGQAQTVSEGQFNRAVRRSFEALQRAGRRVRSCQVTGERRPSYRRPHNFLDRNPWTPSLLGNGIVLLFDGLTRGLVPVQPAQDDPWD